MELDFNHDFYQLEFDKKWLNKLNDEYSHDSIDRAIRAGRVRALMLLTGGILHVLVDVIMFAIDDEKLNFTQEQLMAAFKNGYLNEDQLRKEVIEAIEQAGYKHLLKISDMS